MRKWCSYSLVKLDKDQPLTFIGTSYLSRSKQRAVHGWNASRGILGTKPRLVGTIARLHGEWGDTGAGMILDLPWSVVKCFDSLIIAR